MRRVYAPVKIMTCSQVVLRGRERAVKCGREKKGGNEGDLRATSIAAVQCMAHKSEINRMFIEQLCAGAISASMLPSSSTSRSNRSRRRYSGLCANRASMRYERKCTYLNGEAKSNLENTSLQNRMALLFLHPCDVSHSFNAHDREKVYMPLDIHEFRTFADSYECSFECTYFPKMSATSYTLLRRRLHRFAAKALKILFVWQMSERSSLTVIPRERADVDS